MNEQSPSHYSGFAVLKCFNTTKNGTTFAKFCTLSNKMALANSVAINHVILDFRRPRKGLD